MLLTRVWAKDQPFGAELAEVEFGGGTFSATGLAIGTEPLPYRLEYRLQTAEGYVTRRLEATTQGAGWRRRLVLERAGSGVWSCTTEVEGELEWLPPGGDLSLVIGALDCDLALSPLTNSMPVLRNGLHTAGGTTDFLMAWVAVPQLYVRPSRQRYTFVRRSEDAHVVRYESLDSDFIADITFDAYGLVVDYPGIGRLAPSRGSGDPLS